MRLLPLLALAPFAAFAQWQADLESGSGDGFGIVLFFFAFFAYVHIRDAAREGPAQKWRAVATIITVLVAAYFFEWVRILMAVIFLVSFLHFAWTQLSG